MGLGAGAAVPEADGTVTRTVWTHPDGETWQLGEEKPKTMVFHVGAMSGSFFKSKLIMTS